ncbi:hypothetical protein ACFSCZ_18195 [Siminovitchia sediminis]|uniref:Uncharacterized protein n=1 Tax=Siminovitchia sediminis TaxID=1274353 RepID=A0ABW4KL23_9BACI
MRTFLEKAILNSSRHSCDVWQYMTERGYYPLSPVPKEDIELVSAMHQMIPQPPWSGANKQNSHHLYSRKRAAAAAASYTFREKT